MTTVSKDPRIVSAMSVSTWLSVILPLELEKRTLDPTTTANRRNSILRSRSYYRGWCDLWIPEIFRILKRTGTCYIVSGTNHLEDILSAAEDAGFILMNLITWDHGFPLPTKKRFSFSSYHILRLAKQTDGLTFNTHCRYQPTSRDNGKSLLYEI